MQVPLKRSGFKSYERFRKLSNDRFKDKVMITMKQLGLGDDTNVNIFPVQNWYTSHHKASFLDS